ncbi:sensor protein [Bifidobacterium anseris]|uniref:histidine kinase n=2 Tax=Bifidobacterium anseris TaxID=2020963 RepID=A0A2N5J1M9_9BIFI|nr:HAMP domain-containing sensor histidine kinase [Bifidobacterium anseris]PLS28120.1 sensor protein [Bifidobacterium anseris]
MAKQCSRPGAPGREHAEGQRPIGMFSSLRAELSLLIVVATILAFVIAWLLSIIGINGWLSMPVTIVVTLAFTYFTSRGLTRPLGQMRDAAEAMAQGDYSVRIHLNKDSNDEIGQLAESFDTMADELEHADQMRRDMIANVSHELRTPVSALQAMVENMADGVVEPTPVNMENILSQTHRLSDLISFLLDMSRVEAGASSLEIERLNVAELIDETVGPLEYADAGHGHTIEQRVPDDLVVEGDEARLRQLLTNIIANALKHSRDDTAVLVEAHAGEHGDTVIINVVNFGSDIPKEVRNDIFRRFVKGTSGPGTESGGTGLGLSIARWAAKLHGGTVQVVDDPRGVDFEITLPVTPPDPQTLQEQAAGRDSETAYDGQ